jgi:hypothetical protein
MDLHLGLQSRCGHGWARRQGAFVFGYHIASTTTACKVSVSVDRVINLGGYYYHSGVLAWSWLPQTWQWSRRCDYCLATQRWRERPILNDEYKGEFR